MNELPEIEASAESRAVARKEQEAVLAEDFRPVITPENINLILEGLEKLPYVQVFTLINDLHAQADAFNARMTMARQIIMQIRIREAAAEQLKNSTPAPV